MFFSEPRLVIHQIKCLVLNITMGEVLLDLRDLMGLLDPRDLMGFLVLERGEEDVVTDNYITHCEGEAFEHCTVGSVLLLLLPCHSEE